MSPMALVLSGQTELWNKLRLQRYAAVRQRIDINCMLLHFDRAETEKYIRSHLAYAQGKQDIFTDKAVDDIYKESADIARQKNRILPLQWRISKMNWTSCQNIWQNVVPG